MTGFTILTVQAELAQFLWMLLTSFSRFENVSKATNCAVLLCRSHHGLSMMTIALTVRHPQTFFYLTGHLSKPSLRMPQHASAWVQQQHDLV